MLKPGDDDDDSDHTPRQNAYLLWSYDRRRTESASKRSDCCIVSDHELPTSSDLLSQSHTMSNDLWTVFSVSSYKKSLSLYCDHGCERDIIETTLGVGGLKIIIVVIYIYGLL